MRKHVGLADIGPKTPSALDIFGGLFVDRDGLCDEPETVKFTKKEADVYDI